MNSNNLFEITMLSDDNKVVEGFRAAASIPLELDDHGILNTVLKEIVVWKTRDNVVSDIDVPCSHCILFYDETAVFDANVVVRLAEKKNVVAPSYQPFPFL